MDRAAFRQAEAGKRCAALKCLAHWLQIQLPPPLPPALEFTKLSKSRSLLSLFCQPHPTTLEAPQSFYLALYFLPLASSPINHLANAPSQLET